MADAETMIRALPESPERPGGGAISLDEVENVVIRAGVGYWRSISGARKFPARADMSPRDIASLLRNTVLLRVIDGGADYDYRIVGDAHVIAHGYSMQGRSLSTIDEFSPGYGRVLKWLYDQPVKTRQGFALRGWLLRGETHKQYIHTESVFLPLGPSDDLVDHVLNFSVYIPHEFEELASLAIIALATGGPSSTILLRYSAISRGRRHLPAVRLRREKRCAWRCPLRLRFPAHPVPSR